MKRLVTFLMLFIAVNAFAQDIYWWEDGQWVGNLKTNVNKSFSNVVAAIASASGGAQSPYTNTHNAASASITNVSFILFNGTNDFAIGWGTNRLVFQGTTNVAYNGVSLKDGGPDGNTPQGPWTNWLDAATWGVSNAGTYHLADTNTILVMLGTNRLELQGGATTPTNLAWNGSSLINPAGSSGGSQSPITGNVAYAGFTFSNASQGELVQVPTTNHLQAAGRVSFFDDRARQNDGAGVAGSVRTIPNLSMVVDASNAAGWVSAVIRQTDNVPEFVMSGVSGPSSGYQPGFALSTASRAMVHNGTAGTARSSPGKTAGDEDVMIAVFRGVDEADVVIWGIPGTSADLTSAAMQRLYTARYVEGGTGQNVFNLGKQDFDFTVSGQNTGFVLRVDASSDAVGIRQPGTWTTTPAITDAAFVVWGNVALKGDDQPANTHFFRMHGGGQIYDDGTNLWYRNSTGATSRLNVTAF